MRGSSEETEETLHGDIHHRNCGILEGSCESCLCLQLENLLIQEPFMTETNKVFCLCLSCWLLADLVKVYK